MKQLKFIITILILTITFSIQAQSTEKVKIHTSAQCNTCKEKIETALLDIEGIKSAYLDLNSSTVSVKFNNTNLSSDQIRKILTMIGYDADNLPADQTAYQNLDACCKKDSGH